jgi:hypothetical protein
MHERLPGKFLMHPDFLPKFFALLGALVLGCPSPCPGETNPQTFYAPPAGPAASLPVNGVYPQGRQLAFMGYSGEPARDLTNGFTVAGPAYAQQSNYLEKCFARGWPVVAQLGRGITFADKSPAKYHLNETSLRLKIQNEIKPWLVHPEIVWWAVNPEELRPARAEEMKYLEIVSETIRASDHLHRPVFLYNPNHRNATTLAPVAREVDILGKGSYVNHSGHKRERVWVRWSIEQEIQALAAAGRPGAIPLLMPELCEDPDPTEDHEIRAWVRHDVYLGLASGAKGVLIWSLHPRPEVARTWQSWYDAYAECGRELTGPRALGQVFLFGEPRSDLKISRLRGQATEEFSLGGAAEPATTSSDEATRKQASLPAWMSVELAYGTSRWLFLINSANTAATLAVTGWPADSVAQNAFDDSALPLKNGTPLEMELPAYGVTAIRFQKSNEF